MYQLVPNNDIYNLFIADFQDVENRYHLRWVLDARGVLKAVLIKPQIKR